MKSSVKIGPSYFAKAKNDYSDWRWAWVRELAQNSIDAPGTTSVEFSFSLDADGNTVASCRNDGTPMDRDVLTGKFLAVGESGKNFQAGSVGGFGKAKELIAFCHLSYRIHTGGLLVVGEGGEYDLTETDALDGTATTVVMPGNEVDRLSREVRRFAESAQWDGTITLDGQTLDCKLRKGSPRREFSWGTVYTNKTFKNRLIVRMGGIPMFSCWTELDRTVIIELKGASVDVLTSNRDGLVWEHQREFDRFLTDLVTNKSRALKADNPAYTHYAGAKFKTSKENPEHRKSTTNSLDLVGLTESLAGGVAFSGQLGMGRGESQGEAREFVMVRGDRVGVLGGDESQGESGGEFRGYAGVPGVVVTSVLSEEFVIRNETTLKVPDYYQPDSDQFGTYGRKLARIWGRLVLELHRMFGLEREFAIGFVFAEDAAALYEPRGPHGTVYYVNPAEIVEQKASTSKSMRKRFKLTDREELLAIATHEVVHGMGWDSHNEDFARELTYALARVMKERKRFNWCFA